ncbi:hypothetical protein [Halomonas rhizosphaerae]|uniref:Secreted protein n=1 Tax=Halomonas rhizosphaerae TaxID=3043296 RepID=A0ABT6V1F3_9GAMM|nr:hypothetical protein [Halomonas rhizosphaerae]MDI5891303.1 hypothetical protein [Halomonas rhizosphaerae]MDI5921262.1 hypothetical protein [Halomonas rhizosphaerae]
MNTLLAVLALSLLATTAVAQESSGSSGSETGPEESNERMQEHLDKSEFKEQGTTEAPGGGAEPTENWFGCPPDEADEEECEEQTDETDDEEGAS